MSYRKLDVWQQATDLAVEIYARTNGFPRSEEFGLRLQIRRAAVSIPSNIAEGEGRGSRRDHARFLLMARGSLFELETQLTISERLRFLEHDEELWALLERVGRLISGTLRYVRKAGPRRRPPGP